MSILQQARIEIYSALNHVGFLRRNKYCTALFASDYLKRTKDETAIQRLQKMGYDVQKKEELLLIDFSHKKYMDLLKEINDAQRPKHIPHHPLHTLALRLSKVNTPLFEQPLDPIRTALLLLDEKKYEQLYLYLAPYLATQLRTKQPLPCVLAPLIWQEFDATKEETANVNHLSRP